MVSSGKAGLNFQTRTELLRKMPGCQIKWKNSDFDDSSFYGILHVSILIFKIHFFPQPMGSLELKS